MRVNSTEQRGRKAALMSLNSSPVHSCRADVSVKYGVDDRSASAQPLLLGEPLEVC